MFRAFPIRPVQQSSNEHENRMVNESVPTQEESINNARSLRRRLPSRTSSLTSVNTAENQVKIDISPGRPGEMEENFRQYFQVSHNMKCFKKLIYTVLTIYFQPPNPSAGNIDSVDSGVNTLEELANDLEASKIN